LEERIPADQPLRAIRTMVDAALRELDLHFAALYARRGRPSIPPEHRVRALLLMILHCIRGERQLREHIRYNLAYRWFVGLGMDEAVWDATVFTKNRERLMQGAVTERLFEAVLGQARERDLLSGEHFTVDGTLIRAWAHRDSFHPKEEPPSRGAGRNGSLLLRDTHQSQTDPEARLPKKSDRAVAIPSYMGHVLTENRNGLVVAGCATQSSTKAEREACLAMLEERREMIRRSPRPITLGADKQYQDPDFVGELHRRGVVPPIAEYTSGSNVHKNSLRPEERDRAGLAVSQRKRKLVERVFGWSKLNRSLGQIKLRGTAKVNWLVQLVMTAHNLRRMLTLIYAQ
jgi:transposase